MSGYRTPQGQRDQGLGESGWHRPWVIDVIVKAGGDGAWYAEARVAYDDGANETVPGTPLASASGDGPHAAARRAAEKLQRELDTYQGRLTLTPRPKEET
jgi:hypothetical protein